MESNHSLSADGNFIKQLLDPQVSKVVAVILSIFLTVSGLGLTYSVIWYEHYGSDAYRTLPNKFVSSISWCGFTWLAITQPLDIFRYLVTPLPKLVCQLNYLLKLVFGLQATLYITIVFISRYIFIFWLKNPAAFQHEFWSLFINIWVQGFSWISQFVLYLMLEPENQHLYICTGTMPNTEVQVKKPPNIISLNNVIRISSILTSLFTLLRIQIYKRKNRNKVFHPRSHLSFTLSNEKGMLSDFTTNIISALCFAMVGVLQFQINVVNVKDLKEYPFYLYQYFYYLIRMPFIFFLLTILLYIRNDNLRKMVFREAKNLFNRVFQPKMKK